MLTSCEKFIIEVLVDADRPLVLVELYRTLNRRNDVRFVDVGKLYTGCTRLRSMGMADRYLEPTDCGQSIQTWFVTPEGSAYLKVLDGVN